MDVPSADQQQFLEVIDRDQAQRRFRAAVDLAPLPAEWALLDEALGRVLADDVIAPVDVPSFDRANYDGYAVRAADTYGAAEEQPRALRVLAEVLATGVQPTLTVAAGAAVQIATGGMMPRGADAVVMVEDTQRAGDQVLVAKAVTPGFGVSFAGSDMAAGQMILTRGVALTSRETGLLAAAGLDRVAVRRRPRVAILSTGNEIIAPGEPMRPGMIYDSNGQILADAVRELGGQPWRLGIVGDDLDALRARLREALAEADLVLLSGGTSKGAGDLCYVAVRETTQPGIVAHGVALKPGKPVCLAAHQGKAVAILPGFPTSAIFTFHEFVAPVIRALAGRPPATRVPEETELSARLAVKVQSDPGRTEFLLVGLVPGTDGLAAYPMTGGSGAVSTFSRADGFVTIDRHEEFVPAGAPVQVRLLSSRLRLADLVVIGSHCIGLDYLLGLLNETGLATKFLAVGSTAGLHAARRGECDLAGIHLLDPATGQYNRPFLTPDLVLVEGYGRRQGVIYRPGDPRFEGRTAQAALAAVKDDPACSMVHRNQGSGTQILIDRLLAGAQPPGYALRPTTHSAAAAAVKQGRADWGVAIAAVARQAGLGFLPLEDERYDFVVPRVRLERPGVVAFRRLLAEPAIRARLEEIAR